MQVIIYNVFKFQSFIQDFIIIIPPLSTNITTTNNNKTSVFSKLNLNLFTISTNNNKFSDSIINLLNLFILFTPLLCKKWKLTIRDIIAVTLKSP